MVCAKQFDFGGYIYINKMKKWTMWWDFALLLVNATKKKRKKNYYQTLLQLKIVSIENSTMNRAVEIKEWMEIKTKQSKKK